MPSPVESSPEREVVDPVSLVPGTRRGWLALMGKLGIRPNKGLGQNFLFERGIVQRMVKHAGVGPSDTVLEIGPGLGILTSELLRKAGRVVAVELDRYLAAHLRQAFSPAANFSLVEGDALKVDLDDVIAGDQPYLVVANLPYSAGTAVLRRLLEVPHPPKRITVMLQLEVAERLIAAPPDMSIVGVATQFFAVPRIAFKVDPSVFIPPPTVESAVVILEVRSEPVLPRDQHELFFKIVNAGFRHKRKQVANSLSAELDVPKDDVSAWLSNSGIDPMRRAQTLTVNEWVALTRAAPETLKG